MVRDTDKGFAALKTALVALGQPRSFTVGVHESANGQGRNGVPVVEYASYCEFGTSRMPARSFLRSWADENVQANRERIKQVMVDALAHRRTVDVGMNRIGLAMVGEIQAKIASNIPPPLAASTIKRKGSESTLIDTGTLRSNISYELR